MIKVRDEAFKYYFHFMEERMTIFWSRYEGLPLPWTDDEILRTNKFTNVYRATDRVSQYLISKVIYKPGFENYNEEDILLRILLFKVFNRIDTWELIESKVGEVTIKTFDIEKISFLLTERIRNAPIFNSAYLMTGVHSEYNHLKSKHERWLRMIKHEFIDNRVFAKVIYAKSLKSVFDILANCPFIGDFLAYQYAIDFNYSPVLNFDENSFVKAGIGAVRGIKKCFVDFGGLNYDDLIHFTKDHLDIFRNRYGYQSFMNLFGREPSMIDLQNCFCETDKYLRVKMPELVVDNLRIKQKYSSPKSNIDYYFPPKWGLNSKIKSKCLQQNSMELTPF
jgi:hypothetical protein